MALVTKSSKCSPDTRSAQVAPVYSGGPGEEFLAGEAISAGSPCYMDPADGLIYLCDATANDEKAVVMGWAAKDRAAGQVIDLLGIGTIFNYDEDGGLTPGDLFYLATTAGRLDDAAQTGHPAPVAQAISSKLIRVLVDA